MKEPSCVLNHDSMRRELRDKQLPPTACPACDWLLSPAKPEPELLSDKIEAFIAWLESETDFGVWEDEVRMEVHKKLIEFLT